MSYPARYEASLLRHRRLEKELEELPRGGAPPLLLPARLLSCRADMAGVLASAILEDPKPGEAPLLLLNQITALLAQDTAARYGGAAGASAARADVAALSGLADRANRERPIPAVPPTAPGNAGSTMVAGQMNFSDAFFEEYPECVRGNAGSYCGDSSSDSSDGEEGEEGGGAKGEAPKANSAAAAPSRSDGTGGCDGQIAVRFSYGNSQDRSARPPPPTQHRNPYANPYAGAAPTSHGRNPYATGGAAAGRPGSAGSVAPLGDWGSHEGRRPKSDGVSPASQFMTAREVAGVLPPTDDGGGEYGANAPPSSSPHEAQQLNPSVKNSLSAGLKRKFQPPKRTLGNTAKGSNGGGVSIGPGGTIRKLGGSSGGGGGAASLHRKDGSDGAAISTNANSGGGGDDDNLPEELKGMDKELVDKIMNEIVDSGESVTFDDIAGLHDAKQTVLELVCWPMKRPDLFTGLRRGPNGLLLFGPPGTGKTLIGKAIAHESGACFFSISSSSLTSKWIGEGEKLVRTLFAVAAYKEPAVVFIDEIDSLLTQRKADENEASRRIKTEFLVQLDGTGTSGQGRVLCIGATNRPHELDDAARRRFVKRLYIPLPELADREILLRSLLNKNHHSLSFSEVTKLASAADGFSGADLKALCTDASMGPIRQLGHRALEIDPKDVPPISYKHFRRSLKGMNPSVSKDDLNVYLKFNETYGSKRAGNDDEDDISDASDE